MGMAHTVKRARRAIQKGGNFGDWVMNLDYSVHTRRGRGRGVDTLSLGEDNAETSGHWPRCNWKEIRNMTCSVVEKISRFRVLNSGGDCCFSHWQFSAGAHTRTTTAHSNTNAENTNNNTNSTSNNTNNNNNNNETYPQQVDGGQRGTEP